MFFLLTTLQYKVFDITQMLVARFKYRGPTLSEYTGKNVIRSFAVILRGPRIYLNPEKKISYYVIVMRGQKDELQKYLPYPVLAC